MLTGKGGTLNGWKAKDQGMATTTNSTPRFWRVEQKPNGTKEWHKFDWNVIDWQIEIKPGTFQESCVGGYSQTVHGTKEVELTLEIDGPISVGPGAELEVYLPLGGERAMTGGFIIDSYECTAAGAGLRSNLRLQSIGEPELIEADESPVAVINGDAWKGPQGMASAAPAFGKMGVSFESAAKAIGSLGMAAGAEMAEPAKAVMEEFIKQTAKQNIENAEAEMLSGMGMPPHLFPKDTAETVPLNPPASPPKARPQPPLPIHAPTRRIILEDDE